MTASVVPFVTSEVLEEEPPTCDVCGAPIPAEDDGDLDENADVSADANKWAPAGRGLYVWSRGGETVYEEPPLCGSCSTAIGMSALARWEIEEEEG
jgi:hypothetical protein